MSGFNSVFFGSFVVIDQGPGPLAPIRRLLILLMLGFFESILSEAKLALGSRLGGLRGPGNHRSLLGPGGGLGRLFGHLVLHLMPDNGEF